VVTLNRQKSIIVGGFRLFLAHFDKLQQILDNLFNTLADPELTGRGLQVFSDALRQSTLPIVVVRSFLREYIMIISINLMAFYHKCCNLIG